MIADIDSTETLQMLASLALKNWAEKALFNLLTDKNVVVRVIVAQELQLRGSLCIFNQVSTLLTSADPKMREIAAYILGQLGTPNYPFRLQTYPLLVVLIKDKYADVRAAAAAAMGHLSNESMPQDIQDILEQCMKDRSIKVRISVAFAVSNFSDRNKAKILLEHMLTDPSQEVCEWAKVGLEILAS